MKGCLLFFGVILSLLQGFAQNKAETIKGPQVLQHFDEMPRVVTLPDGKLMAIFIRYAGPGLPAAKDSQNVRARYSNDNGDSWSKEKILFTLPRKSGGFGYLIPMVDQDGEIHIFMLNDRGSGSILPLPEGAKKNAITIQSPLDIWQVRSLKNRTKWEAPGEIWHGRAGDLQSVIQCRNGRIILPFSYLTDRNWGNRGSGADKYNYDGKFNCGILYSDDEGKTWQQSPDVLKTPTSDLSALGAVEPVVIQLNDDRIWMLLRTQMGRFYESYSIDGSRWSEPVPSAIRSSDSPAGLLRIGDGRLLMLVNNCQRFPYAAGGRQVLQAAVSNDEGKTWKGYREVARDSQQKDGPPPTGDNGVSYPYLTLTKDGRVIFTLWVDGTKSGRNIYRLDPRWLDETCQREDFTSGLSNWSVFGTRGVDVVQGHDSKLLCVRKSDPQWPSGAVLNFPAGGNGHLQIKVRLQKDFAGSQIAITDHFSAPFDDLAEFYNLCNVEIEKDGTIAGTKTRLEPMQWYNLVINWNCLKRYCQVLLDGVPVGTLEIQRNSPAASYLRLTSNAQNIDQGMLIKLIEVKVSN